MSALIVHLGESQPCVTYLPILWLVGLLSLFVACWWYQCQRFSPSPRTEIVKLPSGLQVSVRHGS